MRKITRKKLARNVALRAQLLLEGSHKRVGEVKVEDLKIDPNDSERWSMKVRCKSCHQLIMLYGFLWDKWVHTGIGFDEFRLVKNFDRYYAEITFASPEESRLRVAVVTNKRIKKGYETD